MSYKINTKHHNQSWSLRKLESGSGSLQVVVFTSALRNSLK